MPACVCGVSLGEPDQTQVGMRVRCHPRISSRVEQLQAFGVVCTAIFEVALAVIEVTQRIENESQGPHVAGDTRDHDRLLKMSPRFLLPAADRFGLAEPHQGFGNEVHVSRLSRFSERLLQQGLPLGQGTGRSAPGTPVRRIVGSRARSGNQGA